MIQHPRRGVLSPHGVAYKGQSRSCGPVCAMLFTALWLAAAAGVAVALWLLRGWARAAALAVTLPGPFAWPLLGNVALITDSDGLVEIGRTGYLKYGRLFRAWASVLPLLIVLDPTDLQVVLGSPKHTNKSIFYNLLHNFLGDGLITSNGRKWRANRKSVAPLFHASQLQALAPAFDAASRRLLDALRLVDNGQAVNIAPLVNRAVLDVLHDAVLGIPADSERTQFSPFNKGQVVAPYRISRPWLLLGALYRFTDAARRELQHKQRLGAFTKQAMEERKLARKANVEETEKYCMLDHLLDIAEYNPQFTEHDVISEACTFMLAGQDSVSTGVALCLLLLALHPEEQERCWQEVRDAFHGDARDATPHDLQRLPFLEQCVKETLRLYPSVPLIARVLQHDVVLSGVKAPAGCNVLLAPFATHRLPYHFPEPEAFRPQRFDAEHADRRHPYAYLPFSGGIRNCIGARFALMEMKALLSAVLRNYELLPAPGHEQVRINYRMTLRCKGGVWVRLRQRRPDSQ